MDCCSTDGANRFFSRWSKSYIKRFRKKGLAKEQRYLVEGIRAHRVESKSVLEIGSGVGALHLNLLQQGAASAVAVDAAEGMIEQSRALARELGLDNRTRYFVGDFATMNGEIPVSDITVLDKVVCCYENVDLLVDKSVEKTRELYALSFPRNRTPVRLVFKTQILVATLFRFAFRPFWHDWNAVCSRIEAGGFEEVYSNRTFVWDVRIYRRKA